MYFCFKGNIALEKSKRKKPFAWFPDEGWEDVIRLSELFHDKFGSLLEDIERNEKLWKKVCYSLNNLENYLAKLWKRRKRPNYEKLLKIYLVHLIKSFCRTYCYRSFKQL